MTLDRPQQTRFSLGVRDGEYDESRLEKMHWFSLLSFCPRSYQGWGLGVCTLHTQSSIGAGFFISEKRQRYDWVISH